MDFPSVGHGQNDLFVFQARAFLDQIAGLSELPPCPALADGLHNMRVLEAIVAAAETDGKAVKVSSQLATRPAANRRMKLGAYTACLHDRPLAEALDVLSPMA